MSVEVQFSFYYEFTHEQWLEAEAQLGDMGEFLNILCTKKLDKILRPFGFMPKWLIPLEVNIGNRGFRADGSRKNSRCNYF